MQVLANDWRVAAFGLAVAMGSGCGGGELPSPGAVAGVVGCPCVAGFTCHEASNTCVAADGSAAVDAGRADGSGADAGAADVASTMDATATPTCPPPGGCDDGKVCTVDACDDATGMCVYKVIAGPCTDDNACTDGDGCVDGACAGTQKNCDDGNACTDSACVVDIGCLQPAGTGVCDDGDTCTNGDNCDGGKCVSGPVLKCDDNSPCTDDLCDKVAGCKTANNAITCNDGNDCTTGDMCADGKCVGVGTQCDDNNPCTDNKCAVPGGCNYPANTASCEDGNLCTSKDSCKDKACTSGGPKVCSDDNPCTNDGCDPKVGCVSTNTTSACDDGNACTEMDLCKDGKCLSGTSAGSCQCKTTLECAKFEDGNWCNGSLTCDLATSTCKVDPKSVTLCDDNNSCTVDECEKSSGKCTAKNIGDGGQCNADNSVCTAGDACTAGKCMVGKVQVCDDNNPCTVDACHKATGCKFDAVAGCVQSQTVKVITKGDAFDPIEVNVNVGDLVEFTLAAFHNAVEVEKPTWDANGSTPKPGGFNVGLGGATTKVAFAKAGVYYYVCWPHAGDGEKGKITVK